MSTIEEEQQQQNQAEAEHQQMAPTEEKARNESEDQQLQQSQGEQHQQKEGEEHHNQQQGAESLSPEPAKESESDDAKNQIDGLDIKVTTKHVKIDQSHITAEQNPDQTKAPEAAPAAIGTTPVANDTQEPVTSSTAKVRASGRRMSQPKLSRGHAGSFQNYGLAYLPYKSNFEPSEEARRRADEFFKTLKL